MAKVIGFRRVDFTPKGEDRAIKGYKVFTTQENADVTGLECDFVFVSDDKLKGFVPSLGQNVDIRYNKFGKVDSIGILK